MKKIFLFALVAVVLSVFVCYNICCRLQDHVSLPSLLLANIEALAGDEYHKDFAEKFSDTWQDGPFYDTSGNQAREYYWVYTRVDCLGDGVVECESSFSADLVYAN